MEVVAVVVVLVVVIVVVVVVVVVVVFVLVVVVVVIVVVDCCRLFHSWKCSGISSHWAVRQAGVTGWPILLFRQWNRSR